LDAAREVRLPISTAEYAALGSAWLARATCGSLPPVNESKPHTAWQRWVRQPQRTWLRRIVLQVHLWSGVSVGLYIFFISITGSVLVYRNELYVAAMPPPTVAEAQVGRSSTTGFWLVTKLIELHDSLLAGPTGRKVNGVGALAVLLMASTGMVIWWPGRKRWRRSLTLRRSVGWKRFTWDLHSAIGFWCCGFVLVSALSGLYLCFPEVFHDWADRLEPPTEVNAGRRFVDGVLYWLAFLHFGRIDGIGLPCSGPGLCDQLTKAVWALLGLAPAALFATGSTLWWNRVLRPARASGRRVRRAQDVA
jgi:uncharacterized iron-regulated membrane protein